MKKVIWAEGVMLGQQHFQQWEKYYQRQQRLLYMAINPLHWGLIDLQLDVEALLNNKILVKKCSAIFPHGMLVNFDATDSTYQLTLELTPDQESWPVIEKIKDSMGLFAKYFSAKVDAA